MKCWHCSATLPDPEFGKITFRAECSECGAALHTCRNCKYYHPGKPNDCEVRGTDFIPDRTKANLCEDFKLRIERFTLPESDAGDVERKLFGGRVDEEMFKKSPKDKFNSLFKED